jgi:hypothetical protein
MSYELYSISTNIRDLKEYSIPAHNFPIKNIDSLNSGNRYAVVIGINQFQDSGIVGLQKARNDAKIFGKILKSQGQFDYVFIMTDDIDSDNDREKLYPSKFNIEDKINALIKISKPEDLFVVFYSGHAISDLDENSYLLAADTSIGDQFKSSVSFKELFDKFKSKKITKSVVILDAFWKDFYKDPSIPQNEVVNNDTPAVAAKMYSSYPGYRSYEDLNSDYGIFTKHLVVGMEGEADLNQDGVVTILELMEYTQNTLKGWTIQTNKIQKPLIQLHGSETKDIILSIAYHKKRSLVDENAPRMIYESDILLRSFILPGWGQYYANQKAKGFTYMGTWAVLLSYYSYHYQRFTILQEKYLDYNTYPGTGLYEYTLLNLESIKSDLKASEYKSNQALGFVLGFWIFNLFDAKFLTQIPGNDFIGYGLSPRIVSDPYGSKNISEQYGFIHFRKSF